MMLKSISNGTARCPVLGGKTQDDGLIITMAVNTNSKKDRGLVLMLAGIGTGALAQAALLFFVNNTFPLLGLFLYMLAEALLFLGMHTLGDVLPVFAVTTQELSPRKPRFEFWLIILALVRAIA